MKRKIVSLILTAALILNMGMPSAFAATIESGLCEHHPDHTADCGYAAAVAGADCTHVHDTAVCGYVEAVQEVLCTCIDTDESGALVHTEGCGYVAPVTGADCTHTHDTAVCGYVAAVEGHACHFQCAECAASLISDETTEATTETATEATTEATTETTTETTTEVTEETTVAAEPVCTCETDDPALHATNCPAYVAPENPECFCAEKCTEDNINVWCDVCGVQGAEACTTEGEAVMYADVEAKWGTSASDLTGGSGTFAEAIAASPAYIQLQSDVSASYLTISVTTTLDLNNCTITGNGSQRIFGVDGGNLTLTDTSGTQGGKITNAGGDAAVVIFSNGQFTMEAGSITGNTKGGVRVYTGTFTMNGGSITGNTSAGSGGGVLNQGATFILNGGSITGNTGNQGGGIYSNGTFKLSGTVNISGNTGSSGDDIYLSSSNVTIGESLNLSSSVHVYKHVSDTNNAFATAETGVALNDTHKGYFISDNPDYPVVSLDSENNALCLNSCDHANVSDNTCSACNSKMVATLEIDGTTTYHHSLKTAFNAAVNTTSDTPGIITLLDNVNGVGNITMTSGAVTLDLNSRTISNASFIIQNGSILTLKNGTINSNNTGYIAGVYVQNGSVTLDNVKIDGDTDYDIYIGGDYPIIIQSIPDGEVYTINTGSNYNGRVFAKPADGVGALSKDSWKSLAPGGLITENDDGSLAFAACDHSGSKHTTYKDRWVDLHSFTCTVCNGTAYEEHYGGNPTCSTPATCSFCQYSYTVDHQYTYSATENVITETCIYNCEHRETVTIEAPTGTFVYDGTAKEVATVNYSSENWQGESSLTPTYANNINAGTATASISLMDGENEVKASATFTITAKDITGAAIGDFTEMTYTGQAQTPVATVTIDGLTATGSWSKVTNVGEKTTFTASGNFTGKVEVNPGMAKATPDVTASTAELTYKTEAQALVTAGSTTGGTLQYALGNDNTTAPTDGWVTTIPTATNAGTYYVWYKVIGDTNYANVAAQCVEVAIKPKTVTAPTFAGLEAYYPYSGEAIEPTFTLMDGTTVVPADEYTVGYSANTDLGTATITVTDKDGGNYTVSGTATFQIKNHEHVWSYKAEGDTITATCKGTIGTCSVESQTVTLKAPDSLIADGKAKQFTYTGSISGVTPKITYSQEPIPADAGTYTVTMSITVDGETYSVSQEYAILEGLYVTFTNTTSGTTKSADWTPNLAAFDTSTGIHFVTSGYNNKDSVVNGNYTVQWYDAEGMPLSEAPTDAGTYTIKVTLSDSLSGTCVLQGDTLTYTINPLDLSTAIIGFLSWPNGQPKYNGKQQLPDATVGNSSYILPEGSYTIEAIEGKNCTNAGTAYCLIKGTGGNVIGEKERTYSISMAQLDLPDVTERVYTYDGTSKATDFTNETLPDGYASVEPLYWYEAGSSTRLAEAPSDAGEYEVYVKYTPEDTVNCQTRYRREPYTIEARKLTADVQFDTSKVYDTGTGVTLTCTPTNAVDGDSILLTAMAAYDSADVGTGKTITVTFQLSGNDKKNYSAPDRYTVTDAEITPKEVTVHPEYPSARTWDGTDTVALKKTGWSMTGHYPTVDNLQIDLSAATARVETSDAGQDKPVIFENVVVTGNEKGNYTIVFEERTIDIQALNLGSSSVTVTFAGNMPVYTGSTVYPENAVVTVEIMNQGTITLDNSLWEFTPVEGLNNSRAGKAYAYISATGASSNVIGEKYIQYTINKASLTGVTAENVTAAYDGQPHGITVTGIDSTMTVYYGTTRETCDSVEPITCTTVADSKTIWYKVVSSNYEDFYGSATVTIDPATITVTADAVSKIYGEADPELTYTVDGLVNSDAMSGALIREAGTDVGTYAITQGTLTAGSNYTISYTGADLTIKAKAITETDVALNGSLTYTGSEQTQPITVTEGITYTVTGDKATNVGNYTLTVTGTGNYTGSVTLDWSIAKKAASVTAPAANSLTYTGGAQALVTPGTADGGKLLYSLTENGKYTEVVPTGTDAGPYTVWYYVQGDSNHSDTGKASVSVTIAKADPAIGIVSANVVNDTTESSAIVLNRENTGVAGSLTVDEGQTLKLGDNEITWTFTPADTGNYNTVTGTVTVTVRDTIAPTGTVTLSTDSWSEFLNTITFGKYFKETQKVSVTAADNLSGVAKVEYYETKDILDLDGVKVLEDAKWTVMDGGEVSVTAEDAKQFIYYIRITDNSGNVSYLATNGAEFDTTAPVITGVENGKTYYTTQVVTITDKNLETVTLNGETVTGTVTLEGNKDASYTIVATDKAGNSATVTVTMAEIVDIADPMDGLTEENVTSDDKDALEDIVDTAEDLLKDGDLTDKEKDALEDAKEKAQDLLDVIEDAASDLDTENTEKVEDITSENVKPEDKEDLEKAKEDLENALEENPGNYTNEEKQQIQEEIDRIDDAIESIEKVEDLTEEIEKLPDSVEPDDEETAKDILDAKEDYDDLTDHEKSLIDDELKEKLDDLLADLVDYKITEGDGSKWTKDSGKTLSFAANGPLSKFVGIEIDGKEVDAKNYTVKADQTTITLKASYLQTLKTGKHTITVLYTDGEAEGTFRVNRAADPSSPATGDDANIMLWSGMLCVSTLGLVLLLADRKRRKSTK